MAISDKAEDTQSSELVELLKKMGITATFKRQYATIAGRREPDITIQLSDGLILCEAKVPPAGLPQAMGQVSEYRRSIGATEKVKGVFALVYANKLRKDFEAYYSSEISTDLQRFRTLEELAKYILEKTQEKEVRVTPISTQKIIHILDESVGLLSASLSKTSTQELEGVLGGQGFLFNSS